MGEGSYISRLNTTCNELPVKACRTCNYLLSNHFPLVTTKVQRNVVTARDFDKFDLDNSPIAVLEKYREFKLDSDHEEAENDDEQATSTTILLPPNKILSVIASYLNQFNAMSLRLTNKSLYQLGTMKLLNTVFVNLIDLSAEDKTGLHI